MTEILLFLIFVVILPFVAGGIVTVFFYQEELRLKLSPFDSCEQLNKFIRQVSHEIKMDMVALSLRDKLIYLKDIDIKSISCKKTRYAARIAIRGITKDIEYEISKSAQPVSVINPISLRK